MAWTTSQPKVAKEELHDIESVMVIKILCPSSVIGAIIGRGGMLFQTNDSMYLYLRLTLTADHYNCAVVNTGSVMNGFQAATNSKIKISQNNDFYPGTADRVIAITGQPENVTAGLIIVVEKMCEVSKVQYCPVSA